MANIIVVNNNYLNESAVYNEINYAFASNHCKYCGAVGLLWYPSLRRCCTDIVLKENEIDPNIEFMANSFKSVKAAYYKTDGEQISHIVVGFTKYDFMNPILAYIFADQLADYIGQRFQVIYAVHQGSDFTPYYLHIHFVINTVSYVDGNRLYDRRGYYYELGSVAKKISPDIKWEVYKK